jgi:hypothetical protein
MVGGAQAIAALAYGTGMVPLVDIIVGPGNAYVTAAKRLLFGVVMVDMVAGPSEILVLADGSTPARFIAADLLSQAEHDEQAWPILVTTSPGFAQEVEREIGRLRKSLPRQEIISACLERHGIVIIVKDVSEGMGIANRIAPEHLELALEDPLGWLGEVENAGAVFLGSYTPEAVGDYMGGPNHVLPTAGTARFFSPLGVENFVKRTNILSFSRQALEAKQGDVARLARLEGLEAHARAVEVRGECHDVTSPQSDQKRKGEDERWHAKAQIERKTKETISPRYRPGWQGSSDIYGDTVFDTCFLWPARTLRSYPAGEGRSGGRLSSHRGGCGDRLRAGDQAGPRGRGGDQALR